MDDTTRTVGEDYILTTVEFGKGRTRRHETRVRVMEAVFDVGHRDVLIGYYVLPYANGVLAEPRVGAFGLPQYGKPVAYSRLAPVPAGWVDPLI